MWTLASILNCCALPVSICSRKSSTDAGTSTTYPSSRRPFRVLNTDSNTLKCAAVPMRPALGGKLNITSATLRSCLTVLRIAMSLVTRAANMAVRSTQVNMSCALVLTSKVQALWQPVQATPAAPARPPKIMGLVAPSSSGIAIIKVFSTGIKP